MATLTNPLTGRKIKVGGPTYKKLVASGELVEPVDPEEPEDPEYVPDSESEELDLDEFTLIDAFNTFQEVVKISGTEQLIKEVAKIGVLISRMHLEEIEELKDDAEDLGFLKLAEQIDPYDLEAFQALNLVHPAPTTKRGNSGSINERHIGKCLHKLFPKNRFSNNMRPDFMKNEESKKALELDWYSRKLKLAVEYQGKQHYKYTAKFHSTYDKFLKQVELDNLKRKLCAKAGITLIEVPYTIKQANIMDFLGAKLLRFL